MAVSRIAAAGRNASQPLVTITAMKRKFLSLLLALCAVAALRAGDSSSRPLIYTFPIREPIMPSVERLTAKCLAEAREMGADAVLIQMNTYGGLVDAADSVRTALLGSPIPVWVWIDNQAASAGALIALAADSIYMRPGASIGAASVVDQSGRPMPDKFQSFMRATMRATAESHGKVIERIDGGDTVWRWHRDPLVAEAMVGRSAGDSTTLRVLTLTADEAVQRHFSNWGSRRPDRALQREIGRILNDTGVSSNGFPECFDWQERQAKFIMHSLRVYEFFGYGWRTPWWDNDLTAFWQDMDVPAKLNRSFFFYGEKHGWLDAKLKGIPFENELCPPRASKPLSRRIIEAVPPSVLSRLLRATGYTRKFRINEGLHDLYGDIPIERLLAPFSVLPGYLRRHIAPYRKRLASQYDYHQVTLAYAIRWLFFGSVGR